MQQITYEKNYPVKNLWRFNREKLSDNFLRVRETGDFFLGSRNALVQLLMTYNNRNMTLIKYLCTKIPVKKCSAFSNKKKGNPILIDQMILKIITVII